MKKNLAEAKEKKYDRVLVYYSGHGDRETGGWVTYNGDTTSLKGTRIEMKEILELVNESKYNREIEFTTDACFSGK